MPLELKLLWIDAVEIVWVAILSRVNAREHGGDKEQGGTPSTSAA